MNYILKLKYDGNSFYGSQRQNNLPTVNGKLDETLSMIFNENIKVTGCSRTDKGVHAVNYLVMFNSDKTKNLNILKHSLNKLLMPSIYIKEVTINNTIHVRYDVKEKTYIYKINTKEFNPSEVNSIYQYNKTINISLLNKAIEKLKGKHNFKSFTSDTDKDNYIRDIKISIEEKEGIIYIIFVSTGFLRYMIRNIVGLLLDINEGKKRVEDIETIFDKETRTALGTPASPCGLYLYDVKY